MPAARRVVGGGPGTSRLVSTDHSRRSPPPRRPRPSRRRTPTSTSARTVSRCRKPGRPLRPGDGRGRSRRGPRHPRQHASREPPRERRSGGRRPAGLTRRSVNLELLQAPGQTTGLHGRRDEPACADDGDEPEDGRAQHRVGRTEDHHHDEERDRPRALASREVQPVPHQPAAAARTSGPSSTRAPWSAARITLSSCSRSATPITARADTRCPTLHRPMNHPKKCRRSRLRQERDERAWGCVSAAEDGGGHGEPDPQDERQEPPRSLGQSSTHRAPAISVMSLRHPEPCARR